MYKKPVKSELNAIIGYALYKELPPDIPYERYGDPTRVTTDAVIEYLKELGIEVDDGS